MGRSKQSLNIDAIKEKCSFGRDQKADLSINLKRQDNQHSNLNFIRTEFIKVYVVW